ncbi:MAG: hypothetical protein ACRENS_11555, partial [Candidatus Eiseniibacteriota bacterium]
MPLGRESFASIAVVSVTLCALALISTGCAILNFGEVGHEGGDATLGQAAAMAADSSKKDRPLDVGYTIPPETDVVVEAGGSSYAEPSEPTDPGHKSQKGPSDPFQRPVFGLFLSLGSFGGDSYDGYGNGGLSLGGYVQERLRLDLLVRAGGLNFAGQSLQDQAFENTT